MKQVRNYVVQHLNSATCDYVILQVDCWVFGTPYYWTCFDSWFRAAFPPSSGSAFHKKKDNNKGHVSYYAQLKVIYTR